MKEKRTLVEMCSRTSWWHLFWHNCLLQNEISKRVTSKRNLQRGMTGCE